MFPQNFTQSCERAEWNIHVWRHGHGKKAQIPKIFIPIQVEMAKRSDQKRRERELDLNMRWGESKDGKKRDRVRDRGRSRSRSEERSPGLYVLFLSYPTHICGQNFWVTFPKVKIGF